MMMMVKEQDTTPQLVVGHHIIAVIPAYNEERFIGSTVLQVLRSVDTVIVVDDGSHDATADLARRAGAVVIQHACNKGKGVALMTGFRAAQEMHPAVVVTIDADGQHVPTEIPDVIAPILQYQADIVVGSRYLTHTSRVAPVRMMGHHFFTSFTNRTSGVALTDSQSGFRAFAGHTLDKLKFTSRGFSVESEMQYIAHDHKLRVTEVPVTILYPPKHKRPGVLHALWVFDGLLKVMGQYRPLLSFSIMSLLSFLMSIVPLIFFMSGISNNIITELSLILLTSLMVLLSILFFFTAIILHSVRGMILHLTS